MGAAFLIAFLAVAVASGHAIAQTGDSYSAGYNAGYNDAPPPSDSSSNPGSNYNDGYQDGQGDAEDEDDRALMQMNGANPSDDRDQ